MPKSKFLSLWLAVIRTFGLLTGCSNIKYNAQLFDFAVNRIKEDFINDNLVDNLENNKYPTERVFIVKNQEEYNKTFNKNVSNFDFNFDTQMLIVYTFVDIYHRNNSLVSLDVVEDVLTIAYKMEKKSRVGDASKPYQRWFVVKLDMLSVDYVVFVEKE